MMYIKVLISYVIISISRSTSYSNDSNIFPIEINTIICRMLVYETRLKRIPYRRHKASIIWEMKFHKTTIEYKNWIGEMG